MTQAVEEAVVLTTLVFLVGVLAGALLMMWREGRPPQYEARHVGDDVFGPEPDGEAIRRELDRVLIKSEFDRIVRHEWDDA